MSSRLARRSLALLRLPVAGTRTSAKYSTWRRHFYTSTDHARRPFSLASGPRSASVMDQSVFVGTPDRFDGVTVDSKAEPSAPGDIQTKIDDSLQKWTGDNKRCIWFKVNIEDSSWVPLLANRGFNFHHARDDFVMMYKWLPASEANLPPACHTNLGVGGLVLNHDDQLLVVSEKHYQYPHWKLPGGYVERGEDIADAAMREVKEETGVETEFHSLVAFRHTHKMMFDSSDMYIIALLTPTSQDIQISEREISQCQWMDLEEYLNHPNVHEFNRTIVRTALDYRRRGIKICADKQIMRFPSITRDITMMSVVDL